MPSRKANALLAYLICTQPRKQRREDLAGMFWEGSEATGRNSLRQALLQIRKALTPFAADPFLADTQSIGLAPGLFRSDLEELASGLASDGALHRAGSLIDDPDSILSDFSALGTDFDQWRETFKARCLSRLADDLSKVFNGEHQPLPLRNKAARHAHQLDNYNEDAARALMTCHALSGEVPAAIKVYDDLFQRLEEELDIQPSITTQDLAVAIKTESLQAASPPERHPQKPAAPARPAAIGAIAVLPFESLGRIEDPALVSLGLLDDITCTLARFVSTPVISSNSTRQFLNQTPRIETVAPLLGCNMSCWERSGAPG